MASFEDEFFKLLLLNTQSASEEEIDQCIAEKEADSNPRHLGWYLVQRGLLDPRKLDLLIAIQSRDVEDRAPSSEAEDHILADIMRMKNLAAHGDVDGCEEILGHIEALEPYIQLAKVLAVKAQVAQRELKKSNRIPPVPGEE